MTPARFKGYRVARWKNDPECLVGRPLAKTETIEVSQATTIDEAIEQVELAAMPYTIYSDKAGFTDAQISELLKKKEELREFWEWTIVLKERATTES